MSGWRVERQCRRPGTTTDGAVVAPHGVERDADLIGHGSTSASAGGDAGPRDRDSMHGGDNSRSAAGDKPVPAPVCIALTAIHHWPSSGGFFSAASAANGCAAVIFGLAAASNSAPGLRG